MTVSVTVTTDGVAAPPVAFINRMTAIWSLHIELNQIAHGICSDFRDGTDTLDECIGYLCEVQRCKHDILTLGTGRYGSTVYEIEETP